MEGANIVPVMDMNRNNNYGDCWGGGMDYRSFRSYGRLGR